MPSSALFTDLYQLNMLRAYFELGMTEQAAFSLFVRRLPPQRDFLVACGVADLLNEIESFCFEDDHLRYLRTLGQFTDTFLEWLREFRFSGDVYAMHEGTPFFPNEPILEVVAPIAQAQILETLIINQIGLQTILASKAVRMVAAARGRPIMDFGARRAQGIDASIKGARAFYVGGIDATSNLAAGKTYNIPVAGTVAHSFIEACSSEMDAFGAFARIFPDTTLLVDTYDTLAGVAKVISLSRSLGSDFRIRAIRLDSGDLDQLARKARHMLDEAGLKRVLIVASGGLDEHEIDRLATKNAPIDLFGVGTDMAVSSDAPALDIAYKLIEYAGRGRMKLSTGKSTLPGRKQVFRCYENEMAICDVIGRHDESLAGSPLLAPVMLSGRRTEPEAAQLAQIRSYAKRAIHALPQAHRALSSRPAAYEVKISPRLSQYEQEVRSELIAASKDGG
jgi:nicotinate phosphoribosyltransferase